MSLQHLTLLQHVGPASLSVGYNCRPDILQICMQAFSLSEGIDSLPKRCYGCCNIFLSMTWALFARELLQKLSCDLHKLPKACGHAGSVQWTFRREFLISPVPASKTRKAPAMCSSCEKTAYPDARLDTPCRMLLIINHTALRLPHRSSKHTVLFKKA